MSMPVVQEAHIVRMVDQDTTAGYAAIDEGSEWWQRFQRKVAIHAAMYPVMVEKVTTAINDMRGICLRISVG